MHPHPKNNDNTFRVEQPEESPGFLLWQVTNHWQREIKKALMPFGLTHAQFVLLACIHWLRLQGKPVTQIRLSGSASMDPMTTSTVLRTLEKKGYVERTAHATDTRAKTVLLTAKGIQTIKKAVVVVETFDAQFFGCLGTATGPGKAATGTTVSDGLAAFNQQLGRLLAVRRD